MSVTTKENKISFAYTLSKHGYVTAFMATEPRCEGMPETWEPYCPSAIEPEDMSLWASGSTVFGEMEVEDVYAKDEKGLASMW